MTFIDRSGRTSTEYRQLFWDERERCEELEAQLRDIALMAKPVAATAKNTSAVRTGHELGGYIKHYIVPTHLITAIGEKK